MACLEGRSFSLVFIRPALEVFGKLSVRDDIDMLDPLDRRQVIQDVVDHRLARDRKQRLGLRQGQWIKPRRITRG